MAARGSAPAAEPETGADIEDLRAQNAALLDQVKAQAEQIAALGGKKEGPPVPPRPQRTLPKTLRVKVRKGHTMLLGDGPLTTRLRYGAGFQGIREDDPVEMPLYRIFKKEPNRLTGWCDAARNLVLADGKEIEPIHPDEAAELHAAWNDEVAKREAPTDVNEQGKIFSGPKPERTTAS